MSDRSHMLALDPRLAARVNARLEECYDAVKAILATERNTHLWLADTILRHGVLEGDDHLDAVLAEVRRRLGSGADASAHAEGAAFRVRARISTAVKNPPRTLPWRALLRSQESHRPDRVPASLDWLLVKPVILTAGSSPLLLNQTPFAIQAIQKDRNHDVPAGPRTQEKDFLARCKAYEKLTDDAYLRDLLQN